MLPYIWMLCGAFSFACMVAFARGLQGICDWQIVALARALLATIFAAAMVFAAGGRFVVWRPGTLWVRSIAGSMSMLCTFYAVPRLPIADVLTLANIFPVWVALLSWPVLKEKPSAGVWLAIACALGGVALVQHQPFAPSDAETTIQQPYENEARSATVVLLGGSFATAVAMIGLHRLNQFDARAIVAHFSAVATLFCGAALFLFPTTHTAARPFDSYVWLMLMGVGLAATIGQILLTKAFTTGNAAKVSVVALSQIGFAMLFDVVFWDRRFTPLGLLGMALVIVPTAWLLWGETRNGTIDTEIEVV
ncbi:MAG TPA: DMT family transporter [Pirellulales bacterium]